LVQTGFSIYNDVSKKNPDAPLHEESSRINQAANQFILPYTDPSKWSLDIPGMANQAMNIGLSEAPQINAQNMAQLQVMLNQAMPGWQNTMANMAATNAQLSAGQVPTDVQDQITRNAAQMAMRSGIGAGGAGTALTGRTITARDLGLTSLDLEKTGQAQTLQQMQFQRNYLMPQPVNPTSLVPLSDLIGANEWSKTASYNANIQAFIAKSNAAAAQVGAPQQSLLGGVGGDISGLLSSLGKTNPQTGQSGFSSLMNLFGGGSSGSSGGSGGWNLSSFGSGSGATIGSTMDSGGSFAGGGTMDLGFLS
jgi:hypothetical protein